MTVPEATVNEDDGSMSRQNYVGLSGQILSVQTKAVS
jgi:hypothetical protein